MIFPEKKKSALVRLTDSIKDILNECLFSTQEIIYLYEKNQSAFEELKSLAKETIANDELRKDFDDNVNEVYLKIPEEEAMRGAQLQRILHSQSLQVILTSCFALESYINSLAYHLFKQVDYLGLVRAGHETTAEIILKSIDKMSAMNKWDELGKFNAGQSFDKSKPPYQNCKIMFEFRNDIVHDKVVELSNDRGKNKYNNLLTDPVFGMLDLSHANFAAQTYWEMVTELHRLLNYDFKEFHLHYNLTPWYDNDHKAQIQQLAVQYKKQFHNRD